MYFLWNAWHFDSKGGIFNSNFASEIVDLVSYCNVYFDFQHQLFAKEHFHIRTTDSKTNGPLSKQSLWKWGHFEKEKKPTLKMLPASLNAVTF